MVLSQLSTNGLDRQIQPSESWVTVQRHQGIRIKVYFRIAENWDIKNTATWQEDLETQTNLGGRGRHKGYNPQI
jgi:hypothetical protein